MPRSKATITPPSAIAKYPNWTTLPNSPVTAIFCDYRMNCEIDVNDIGRVQMKPGYNANFEDVRYEYGR